MTNYEKLTQAKERNRRLHNAAVKLLEVANDRTFSFSIRFNAWEINKSDMSERELSDIKNALECFSERMLSEHKAAKEKLDSVDKLLGGV